MKHTTLVATYELAPKAHIGESVCESIFDVLCSALLSVDHEAAVFVEPEVSAKLASGEFKLAAKIQADHKSLEFCETINFFNQLMLETLSQHPELTFSLRRTETSKAIAAA